MHIATIVTDDNIRFSDFIRIVKPEEYTDDGSYALIIGKDNVSRLFPYYKIKYIDRKIDNRHFWTFSKFEKRNIYENDIDVFKEFVFKKVFKNVKYKPIEVLYCRFTLLKKYINILRGDGKKITFISDNGVYVYYDNHIYGISLDECEYVGITRERLINFLKGCNNVTILFSDKFLSGNDRVVNESDIKYVPYLYFLGNC